MWNFIDLVEGHQLQLTNNADKSRTFVAIYMHDNRLYISEGTVPDGDPEPGLFQQSLGFVDSDGNGIRYRDYYDNDYPPPPRAGGRGTGPAPADARARSSPRRLDSRASFARQLRGHLHRYRGRREGSAPRQPAFVDLYRSQGAGRPATEVVARGVEQDRPRADRSDNRVHQARRQHQGTVPPVARRLSRLPSWFREGQG